MLPSALRVPWTDYLANITPDGIRTRAGARICPTRCRATTFLARYGGTADTRDDRATGPRYRVRAPTAHPVYERQRAEEFRQLLLDVAGRGRTRAASAS